MPNKNKSLLFCLFVLALFYGVNNYLWLRLDQVPPVDDEAFHLKSCLFYSDVILHPDRRIFPRLIDVDSFYPPLFPILASFFVPAFKISADLLIMTNVLFVFGIFACLYLIGIKMGNNWLGVLASFILSLYPMFFQLSRMFMLEVALCFWVVAGIAAMLYNEDFQSVRMSVLLGIILGLGLLTKQYYFVFIIGPWVFLLVNSFLHKVWLRRKKIILNFLLSWAIGIGIASVWYIPNWGRMFPLLVGAASDDSLVPENFPLFSARSVIFYLLKLVNEQILLFFFLIFIFALLLGLRGKKSKYWFMLIAWVITPYAILTVFKNKFLYYTFGYLPAIALICACGILSIRGRILRRTSVISMLAVGFFQAFLISYNNLDKIDPFVYFWGIRIRALPAQMTEIIATRGYFPRQGDWQTDKIIGRILKECGDIPARPLLGILGFEANALTKKRVVIRDNYALTNLDYVEYSLLSKKIPIDAVRLHGLDKQESGQRVSFIIAADLLEYMQAPAIKKENYRLLDQYLMPDKSRVYLYRAKTEN